VFSSRLQQLGLNGHFHEHMEKENPQPLEFVVFASDAFVLKLCAARADVVKLVVNLAHLY